MLPCMHRAWKSIAPAPSPTQSDSRGSIVLSLCAAACLILAGVRMIHVISFTAPLQLVTSGAEEEALASIWRFVHGEAVYTDARAIPYTASNFNILFYTVYGTVAGGTLRLLGLNDAWLPTICRLITLAFALAGAAIFGGLTRTVTARAHSRLNTWSLAALAFFNPLNGFWVITTRPDVGAAVLELAGIALFFRYRRTMRPCDLLGAILCLAAAWAFKQTSVGALTGIVLAMLTVRGRSSRPNIDARPALLSAALLGASVAIPCLLLGPVYRHGLYLSQIHSGFRLSWALLHFGDALIKMPFIAVALAGSLVAWRGSDAVLRTVSLILGASFLIDFAASSKGGAGDYYFLSLAAWSALWIALTLERFPYRALYLSVIVASVLQLAAVGTVLAGHVGALDPRDPALPYDHLARYLAARPGPVFVQDTYGDLPWISRWPPHFVVAYTHEPDARAGVPFEGGGPDGLLARGYFATVVMKADAPGPEGTRLARYRFIREEAGWRYYERFESRFGAAPTSPGKSRAVSP